MNVTKGDPDLCFNCVDRDLRNAHLNYISETTRVVVGAISCAVATLGVFTNLVNILVFRCQGFQDTVNISLLALAVSDLLTLVAIINYNVIAVCELNGKSILPRDFTYPASWPIFAFAFNSCWIAVFISVERCLSVTLPFKVKDIITRKVTAVSLLVIFCAQLTAILPVFFAMRVKPLTVRENVTVLVLGFTSDRNVLEDISYVFMIFLQYGSFACLLLSTFVLIISLQRQARLRMEKLTPRQSTVNKGTKTTDHVMTKEARVVKMVVLVSVIILLTFTPGQTLNMITFFRPEFNFGQEGEWLFRLLWASTYVFYAFNAGLNLLIYYRMSSKFRNTLLKVIFKRV